MPRGDKDAYTDKQKRQAQHIEKGYEKRGLPAAEAESRAWATVNKQDGGGKKSGSGRSKLSDAAASRKATAAESAANRAAAALKGWETRRKKAKAKAKPD